MSTPTKSASSSPPDGPQSDRRSRAIRRIEIESFRGIAKPLTLEFSATQQSHAVIIQGDNGTGKSSIVDAIQFAAQGDVTSRGENRLRDFIQNKIAGGNARVAMRFADGEECVRSVVYDDKRQRYVVRGDKPGGFSRNPLVLRRSDIVRFWDTHAESRQLVFLRYFKPGAKYGVELPQERVSRLEAQRLSTKKSRNDAIRDLADEFEIPPGDIPRDIREFNIWVNNTFHGGWDRKLHKVRNRTKFSHRQASVISRARSSIKQFRQIEQQLRQAKKRTTGSLRDNELEQVLAEASSGISAALHQISSTSRHVDAIEIRLGKSSSVAFEIAARMKDGTLADPRAVLSEANRDLLALLIFVGVMDAAVARGEARVMILDDVFQSVDAPIRAKAVNFLLDRHPKWQLVFTVHDRLWRNQLREALSQHGWSRTEYDINQWSPDVGPVVGDSDDSPMASLNSALATSDPGVLAAQSGRTLEQLADRLSWTLPVPVTRRRGDQYTLVDLWPPIQRSLARTEAATTVEEIDQLIHIRNMYGAHPNEWAEGLSSQEIRDFAQSILKLGETVHCHECSSWIQRNSDGSGWECSCGGRRLSKS